MPRFSVITTFLGQTRDRFHTYQTDLSLEEKFRAASKLPGYDAVEIVYPYEVQDPEQTKRLLAEHNLCVSAVNVNVKGEPEFVEGGLTADDRSVRNKAVKFIQEGKDFAAAIGAPRVTCCPLGDGFEFVFQKDYRVCWKRLCDTLGEAGAYREDDVPLFVEYKPKETRRVTFLPRAADVLWLLRQIGVSSMGVTLDYGHSVYGGEHPTMSLCMVEDSPYEYYIHINDNDKTWDWDYFCGSHTLLDYVEFVYYLKKFGYDKHLTSDTQPTRWDVNKMFSANSRLTQRIWSLLDEIGNEEIERAIQEPDYMETWKFVEERILGFTDR
jgi:xylose isomerase